MFQVPLVEDNHLEDPESESDFEDDCSWDGVCQMNPAAWFDCSMASLSEVQ